MMSSYFNRKFIVRLWQSNQNNHRELGRVGLKNELVADSALFVQRIEEAIVR